MIALENSLPLPQMPTYAGFIRKSQCQHSDVQEWKWWRYLDFSPSTLWLLHMLHADIPTPMESHGFCHDDELKITAERWYCGKIEGVVCSYYSGVIQTLYKSGRTPGWRRKPIGILQRLNINAIDFAGTTLFSRLSKALDQDTSQAPACIMCL